jgi:glycosyltransferase involved in cell wall biosynthesis
MSAGSEAGLRVAMFTPWRARCGISDYSRHLVTALRGLPEIADVRIVEASTGAARGSSLEAVRHFASDARRWRDLGAQMNADTPDVAHVQHQYFFFGGVAPHKSHIRAFLDAVRVPLVMTVHEIAQPPANASLLQRQAIAFANRLNFLHPAIRHLIVHTEGDRQQLIACGVPAEHIHILRHGIPPAAPLPEPVAAKRALGLEGKQVVTLFGFLAAKKGHRLALAALRSLPADIVLLFAGDQHPDDHTDYVPNLRAEIEALDLQARVQITGYLPEERVPLVMAATDVAIAPFVQSSGSGSVANLLAYGRPVLASDIPPHQEIAREAPVCLELFPSGDAEALAAQLQALLADAGRRAALHAAALAYAERHSYVQMARETVAIYRLASS